jgi:hypothetical protein
MPKSLLYFNATTEEHGAELYYLPRGGSRASLIDLVSGRADQILPASSLWQAKCIFRPMLQDMAMSFIASLPEALSPR